MSDLVAWVKEQVRKSHLKEMIRTHTGLTPPAFIAVVVLATAGTALTVSAVSSLLAPPKKNDRLLDAIIEEEIMPFTPSNQREAVDVIPVVLETTKEEEETALANDVEAPAPEKVEAPVKEETVETTAPELAPAPAPEATAADGEDNISSDYVEFEETVV